VTRLRARVKGQWRRKGDVVIPIDPNPDPYWSDEFTAPISPAKWTQYSTANGNDTYGSGGAEHQRYRTQNNDVSNGTLKITAVQETTTGGGSAVTFGPYAAPLTGIPAGQRTWTSGFLSTRESGVYFPLFSKFEMRCRLPHGQGLLPAFWLRRKDGGAGWAEVDIMEYFYSYRPGQGRFTLHFPNSIGANAYTRQVAFETAALGTGGWHVWDVTITPAGENVDPLLDPIWFRAHCDGVEFAAYKVTNVTTIRDLHMIDRSTGLKIDPANPRLSWDCAVNLAVGNRWTGHPSQQLGYLPGPDRCSKSQNLPPSGAGAASSCDLSGLFFAQSPALMEVDYVRIYDLGY